MCMRLLSLLACLLSLSAAANERTIDISGNNTSSDYKSYSQSFSLPAADTVNVKMARYCYFSSTITGKGTLNLFAGGERCYLGTEKGKAWPNWSGYTGDIHVYPFPENSSSAGFYGVVLAHGGKSFSPENIDDAVRSGKVNTSMQNNRVTLHSGATLCCEANTAGAGFRIGELQAETGTSIIGYMKKNTRAAYFLVGCMNTDATLAGTIAPPDYSDTHPVGIIKEGSGTYSITGNNNYLTGALRILDGRVLVMNDAVQAQQKKLRGALGARTNDSEAIAYVFGGGVLGGTGSIGGSVDNYGIIEPGTDATGVLTIANYATPSKSAHLFVRPSSVLRFKINAASEYDRLVVGGNVKYINIAQDFSVSDEMPVIQLVVDNADLAVGDEFVLLSARKKTTQAGLWQFKLHQPAHFTWELIEDETDEAYTVKARVVSLSDAGQDDDPDHPDDPDTPGMGAFYNDGIDDQTDTRTLRYYATQNDKRIGIALSTWKTDVSNENLTDTRAVATQFSMLVAENEMKMDALQPQQGQFSYGAADQLVSFAQRHQMNVRGHCLVWHQQQPEWVSSDGKKNDKNWTRQQALQILYDHISNVMTHFKGRVSEWDVVNECLDDDQSIIRSNPDAYTLRQNVWLRAIGEDYIDSAFVYARRADPDAVLYLNDYDVELQGKAKAVAFRNLANRLRRSGIPIDGVGLQCHFSVGDVDSVKLARTFNAFAQDGMKCIITELDIGVPSTSAENLEEQARLYRVITDIMLNNANCPHVVVWGLRDNDSWRSQSSPLLYSTAMSRKPAWYAVRSALRHRTLVSAGLGSAQSDAETMPATAYDLQGRRVCTDRLTRGVYIINGKKIFIK